MGNPNLKGLTHVPGNGGQFVSTKPGVKLGRPNKKEAMEKKIAKAKESQLSDEDQIELYLAESTNLLSDVVSRIKKYVKLCKDPGELSRVALNIMEIQDKLKGNRTAARARVIKKTAEQIQKSNDRAALIAAGAAKTPADLAQIVVDKEVQTPQT